MQQFIQKSASIEIHVDGKLLPCEPAKTCRLLFAHILSRTEIRKTSFETFVPNGRRDQPHIESTVIKITSTALSGATPIIEMDRREIINRSGGNMQSSIQEHLYSRIPELSETLPL